MKPGKPLERKTPMPRPSKPMPVHKPLQSRCKPMRRTPINPVSAKRRAENVERRVVVSAMRELAGGRCPRCGGTELPLRGHERLARAHGGDIIHPDALLDDLCNSAIEDAPQVSCWNGWKVSPKWPHDPALQPWEARSLDGAVVDLRALVPEEASA